MSEFLLDTNIPSELIRARPHPSVEQWFFSQREPSLFLSAVTIGELRKGVVLLPAGPRRAQLERWLESSLVPRFHGRILPVTHKIADRWGALDGQCQSKGAPLNTVDGMIAATALEHGLTLVTRNVKDFGELGVPLLNPWNSPGAPTLPSPSGNSPSSADDDALEAAMEAARERSATPRPRSMLEAERERVAKGHKPDVALQKWGPLLEKEVEEILANERKE